MLVWIDLEMTGLDAERDRILEVAAVVTDDDLNIVGDALSLVIHQPPEVLGLMQEVVSKMHDKSGLTAEVRASRLTLEEAEQQTLAFIQSHVSEPGKVPICGNSIGMDRRFLNRWMPKIENLLDYHVVDVSSIKEVAGRWYPAQFKARPKKQKGHRALDDILESIDELRYWREAVFVPPGDVSGSSGGRQR